jgi:hypothetical protein
MKQEQKQIKEKEVYTDEEINELAEWLEDLTLKQCFFLKDTYESWLKQNALSYGNSHVH